MLEILKRKKEVAKYGNEKIEKDWDDMITKKIAKPEM